MPLEFLKRRGQAAESAAQEPAKTSTGLMPEEAGAQDHQLKLYYAGKSSDGVRMKAGPAAARELPSMLVGLARSDIEIVEPLSIEYSQATPTIVMPSEAMQWLNAHHAQSPITRHALMVLESIDAVDLAFDTFVCALLEGEVDTAGYPEYNAIIGGVAAHWDEATGDMICRAVVGWGGRGVRGDTDRLGAKILAGLTSSVRFRRQGAAGLCAHTAGLHRAMSVRSTAPSAACASFAAERATPPDAALRLRLRGVWPPFRGRPRRPRRRTNGLPDLRQRPDPQGDLGCRCPLQGVGLGQEGAARVVVQLVTHLH